jgi:hypothetical protein
MALRTVQVPAEMADVFAEAEAHVQRFFDTMEMDPSRGTITIGGQRYILVSADSMSVGFTERFASLFPRLSPDVARTAALKALYDVAFSAGRNDAAAFHRTTGCEDPIERLSTGPVHFSFTGWARVHLWSGSKTVPNEDYFLVYDHPNSFEADSWLRRIGEGDAHAPSVPVCVMNAGYSAGWCTESFHIPLVAREITCRALGGKACRFVMAHRDRLDEALERFAALGLDPDTPLT